LIVFKGFAREPVVFEGVFDVGGDTLRAAGGLTDVRTFRGQGFGFAGGPQYRYFGFALIFPAGSSLPPPALRLLVQPMRAFGSAGPRVPEGADFFSLGVEAGRAVASGFRNFRGLPSGESSLVYRPATH